MIQRQLYEKLASRELTLADYLAIDRTVLANERTALAYGRTVLAMLVIGGTIIHFFPVWYMWIVGGLFIAGAFVVLAMGWRRYRQTQRYLAAALSRQTGDAQHPLRDDVKDTQADVQQGQ